MVDDSLDKTILETHSDSFIEKVPRFEGESDLAWSDRRYAVWLAEEEEYALYGMFY